MPIGDKFQIGEFKFIILDGRWVPPFEHKEAWDRKGLDGIQTATSGKRGVPFTLRSFRDCEDWEEADQLIEKYRGLISEDPVTCVLNGVTSDKREKNPFKVDVQNVQPVEHRESPVISGGFSEESTAMLVCEWTLIAIATEA